MRYLLYIGKDYGTHLPLKTYDFNNDLDEVLDMARHAMAREVSPYEGDFEVDWWHVLDTQTMCIVAQGRK